MIERFLVRDTANSGWLVFSNPIDVIVVLTPVEVLDALREVERRVNEGNLFAAGFISYEAAPGFDPSFVTHAGRGLPLICFGLFSEVQRVENLVPPDCDSRSSALWHMSTPRDDYIDDLSAIKRQIELGNTYQINYTVREHAMNISDPWQLFLNAAADAPYATYIECKDHAIVSASPELFCQLDGEQLVSKPMKGTTPRGMTAAGDLALRQELQDSYKNRAENVMITDMVRNDLGRIARPGTVTAASLFEI